MAKISLSQTKKKEKTHIQTVFPATTRQLNTWPRETWKNQSTIIYLFITLFTLPFWTHKDAKYGVKEIAILSCQRKIRFSSVLQVRCLVSRVRWNIQAQSQADTPNFQRSILYSKKDFYWPFLSGVDELGKCPCTEILKVIQNIASTDHIHVHGIRLFYGLH